MIALPARLTEKTDNTQPLDSTTVVPYLDDSQNLLYQSHQLIIALGRSRTTPKWPYFCDLTPTTLVEPNNPLKADEKVAGYIPTYVHTLQALFFQTFLALA